MNRIKCIRVVKGYSQAKFGEIFNVDQTAVSNWENEKNNVDIKLLENMANYFDIPMDFICGREIIPLRPQTYWHESELQDYKNAPEVIKDYLLYKFGIGVFSTPYLPLEDAYKRSNISEFESLIIDKCRQKPEMMPGICAMLGITQKTPSANIAEDVKEETANFTALSRQTINTK